MGDNFETDFNVVWHQHCNNRKNLYVYCATTAQSTIPSHTEPVLYHGSFQSMYLMFCSVSTKHTLCYIIKLRVRLVTRLTANYIYSISSRENRKTQTLTHRGKQRGRERVQTLLALLSITTDNQYCLCLYFTLISFWVSFWLLERVASFTENDHFN